MTLSYDRLISSLAKLLSSARILLSAQSSACCSISVLGNNFEHTGQGTLSSVQRGECDAAFNDSPVHNAA